MSLSFESCSKLRKIIDNAQLLKMKTKKWRNITKKTGESIPASECAELLDECYDVIIDLSNLALIANEDHS